MPIEWRNIEAGWPRPTFATEVRPRHDGGPCLRIRFRTTWRRPGEPNIRAWGGNITIDPGGETYSLSAGGQWKDGRYVETKAVTGIRPLKVGRLASLIDVLQTVLTKKVAAKEID